jgi:hypothetical protein
MDTYRINTYDLWYGILYPIIFIVWTTLYVLYSISKVNLANDIDQTMNPLNKAFSFLGIYLLFSTVFIAINIVWNQKWKTSSIIDIFLKDMYVQIYVFSLIVCGIYYIIIKSIDLYQSSYTINSMTYEHFDSIATPSTDTANISKTLTAVQQVTESLRNSLDILDNATDDTCTVMKGIEQKFLDNATSPSGDGDPPSKAEAEKIKARKLPGATKQWKQKQQDWADTHGQIPVVECFTDGSLSDLVDANNQLKDLLASAPVQRVILQVKRLQTSELFAQKYMDDLANQLTRQPEGFDNLISEPTPEDTIATSNKLIQQAKDVQAQIQRILASTKELKSNYAALNAKANNPNTVNNLAQSTSS